MMAVPTIVGDQITVGTRVEFDSKHGHQTGTVYGLMQSTAIVDIDHTLPGIQWAVPMTELHAIKAGE